MLRWRNIFIAIGVIFLLGGIVIVTMGRYLLIKVERTAASHFDSSRFAPTTTPSFFSDVLGFNGERTYLLLFLNNTELRPGGGFIGAYAVVKIINGNVEVVRVEGTENLDGRAVAESLPLPPAPLAEHLGVTHWFFRDSNWSPDFVSSTKLGLDLYRKEGGVENEHIAAVVGITPTVLEELLRVIGPVKVGGMTYNAETVIKELEYEVEYGYAKRGVHFRDRKAALDELVRAVVPRLVASIVTHGGTYYTLATRLLDEKQIVAYAPNADWQQVLMSRGWAGAVTPTAGDYLLWADANLGALKTDAALDREMSYSVTAAPTGTGRFLATAATKYTHHGIFDWRTSRYRSFTRIYVPMGSELKQVTLVDQKGNMRTLVPVAETDELGYRAYGVFFSVEPGTTATLSFSYYVAPSIAMTIQNGGYRLLIQKQIGTLQPKLTLDFDFGSVLTAPLPASMSVRNVGGSRYTITTDLSVDREFLFQLLKK